MTVSVVTHSMIRARASPLGFPSQKARTASDGSVVGNLLFQSSISFASLDGLEVSPTINEALTLALPGTQTFSHSSQETFACKSSLPLGTLLASFSGTSNTAWS